MSRVLKKVLPYFRFKPFGSLSWRPQIKTLTSSDFSLAGLGAGEGPTGHCVLKPSLSLSVTNVAFEFARIASSRLESTWLILEQFRTDAKLQPSIKAFATFVER